MEVFPIIVLEKWPFISSDGQHSQALLPFKSIDCEEGKAGEDKYWPDMYLERKNMLLDYIYKLIEEFCPS